jgi:hypothetical protein
VAWSNQTWIRANDPLIENELTGLSGVYPSFDTPLSDKQMTLEAAINLIGTIAGSEKIECSKEKIQLVLTQYGITDLAPQRVILRKEMALLIDKLLDPFNRKHVNIKGEIIP